MAVSPHTVGHKQLTDKLVKAGPNTSELCTDLKASKPKFGIFVNSTSLLLLLLISRLLLVLLVLLLFPLLLLLLLLCSSCSFSVPLLLHTARELECSPTATEPFGQHSSPPHCCARCCSCSCCV